ncbi:HAD family hydrolase [Thermomonas sp.]|uniref:HAD family hydrolase n=1 Tax=Thermomonas sp. TaxID=1971895 RepID=UPI0024883953|nr:HAD family hydrolase [Thermomonas sp.]MDI1253376.1 HAD family hydrolase [Thermomonas sp.]
MLARDPASEVVFLLDVDNTLFDNDRFKTDLDARVQRDFGEPAREEYWQLYERERERLGYADYLAALQAFREGREDDPDLLRMSGFMLDYPFAERVYPGALEAVERLHELGTPVILSDGDVVFQPRKVQNSGLWEALRGRVLIYLHKQNMLDAVQRRYPARHYVVVDDKPQLLATMKQAMGERLTTVFVRQGHYAAEADVAETKPPPDLTIERIGELATFDLQQFSPRASGTPAPVTTAQEST